MAIQACPSLNELCQLNVSTATYVPNSVRPQVNGLYHKLFSNYLSASSESKSACLDHILAVPKLVLRKNGKHEPRNRNRSSLHRSFRARISLVNSVQWERLTSEALKAFPPLHRTNYYTIPGSSNQLKIKKCRQAVQQGALSKACQNLTQTTPPVPPSEQNAALLQTLHPFPPVPVQSPPLADLPAALVFSEAEVRRCLKSLPSLSSPGPDGLRPSVLKTLSHTPGGTTPDQDVMASFTAFINDAVDGSLPSDRQKWFAGGKLIALPKSHTSVRPIAMGMVLRRFIGRLIMSRVSRDLDIQEYFLPTQLSVGVSGGCDAIIHAVRYVVEALKDEDLALLRLDAKNAFNSISRQNIIDQTILKCPYISRWVAYTYGHPSSLFFGNYVILSRTGTQQGDPLGMLLFSLVLHPLIQEMQRTLRPLFTAFYADDGTVVTHRHNVNQILQFLIQRGSQIGFTLNVHKTDVWWPRPCHIPQILCNTNRDKAVIVLGSPIGDPNQCIELLQQKRESLENILQALRTLGDPQIAFHLQKSCASACRLMYILRTTPPHITIAEAKYFDLQQRRVFEATHRMMTNSAWYTATLPPEDGGLGLTSTEILAPVAYVGSLFNVWKLLHDMVKPTFRGFGIHGSFKQLSVSIIAAVHGKYSLGAEYTPHALFNRVEQNERLARFQDEMMEKIDNFRHAAFCPHARVHDRVSKLKRARMISSAVSESYRTFTSIPNSELGTRVEPEIWRTMIDLRLGNPLFSGNHLCPQCVEGTSQNPRSLDDLGYHAATCPGGFGTTRRHNSVFRFLFNVLRRPAVSLQARREKPLLVDGSLPLNDRRRMDIVIDDIEFSPQQQGFDITIVSPHNRNLTTKAVQTPGGSTVEAERRKHEKYDVPCSLENMVFTPIAIDIHGALVKEARAALWQFSSHISRIRGSSPSTEYGRIAVPFVSKVLQATAVAINRRRLAPIPHSSSLNIVTAMHR